MKFFVFHVFLNMSTPYPVMKWTFYGAVEMGMRSGLQYQYRVHMLPLYLDSYYYFIVDRSICSKIAPIFFLINDSWVTLGNIMGLMWCCIGYPITRQQIWALSQVFSLHFSPCVDWFTSSYILLIYIYISILQCSRKHP